MIKIRTSHAHRWWGGMAIAGVAALLPLASATVYACHSEIAAQVNCAGVVSWTASSWSNHSPEGTNPDIRVFLQVESQAKVQISSGAFTAGHYSFSGTFQWPLDSGGHLASYIWVSSQPFAKWGDGDTSTTGESVKLLAPTGCKATPTATIETACDATTPGNGSGKVTVVLGNTGGPWAPSVTFRVYTPDQTVSYTTRIVAAGGTTSVTFTGLEPDGAHSVKVSTTTYYTGFPKTLEFTTDCDQPMPAVDVRQSCNGMTGDVTFTFSNTGGEPVTFHAVNPLTLVASDILVAAGGSQDWTVTGLPNGDYTVSITAGLVDLSQKITVDCLVKGVPSIEMAQACSAYDGTVDVRLIVTGGNVPFTFNVQGIDHVVLPGESTLVQITGLPDGPNAIAVMVNKTDLGFTAQVACDQQDEDIESLPPGGVETNASLVAASTVLGGGLLMLLGRRKVMR